MLAKFSPLPFCRSALSAAADLLFPRACAACDAPLAVPTTPFCQACAATLQPLIPAQICPRCAMPLSAEGLLAKQLGPTDEATLNDDRPIPPCERCRDWPAALSFAFAPFEYGGALAEAIIRLKWNDRDDLAQPLAALLAPQLAPLLPRCDIVVPVPLHPQRLRQRGYNQATLLAHAALTHVGRRPTALATQLLCRLRPDPPARAASIAERWHRTRDAFSARHAAPLSGQRILLLDDVITTGATVMSCALALRQAGAIHVEALALARAT